MNLPNKLTVARVVMIPLFMAFFLIEAVPFHYFFALLVFAAAAYTDRLDGKIARDRGLVTGFGKMMDPLADKMLVMSAMVLFIPVDMAPPVAVVVILAREFLVSAIRMVAAADGVVIAADIWGKAKTVAQIIWICGGLLLLALEDGPRLTIPVLIFVVYNIVMYIVVFLTLASGFNYVWKNRRLFKDL